MTIDLLKFLFSPQYAYPNQETHSRANQVLRINWVIFIAFMMGNIYLAQNEISLTLIIFNILLALLNLIIFISIKVGQSNVASYTLVIYTVIAAITALQLTPNNINVPVIVLMIPIVFAGLLLSRTQIIGIHIILMLLIIGNAIFNVQAEISNQSAILLETSIILICLTIVMIIQILFSKRENNIDQYALQNIDQLKEIWNINNQLNLDTTEEKLLQETLTFIQETFAYDRIQIYLLDENDRLSRLIRSDGNGAIETLSKEAAIKLGETNALSEALRLQETIQISLDDVPARREHFLPSIRRGMVMPILNEDKLIGILDIQITMDAPFSTIEIETLTLLAKQLGYRIDLVNHLQWTQKHLDAQDTLVNRLQTQIATLQQQRQQITSVAWGEYIEQQGRQNLGFDLQNNKFTRADDLPDAMRTAIQNNETYINTKDDNKFINVPIILRGEVLGAMTFTIPVNRPITERQIELIKIISNRLGSALENVRLLQQSQAQANRERKAGEISNLLISATDIDSLLRLAADSLNDSLGAIQTRIFLEPLALKNLTHDAEQMPNGKDNGKGKGRNQP